LIYSDWVLLTGYTVFHRVVMLLIIKGDQ